MGSRNDAGLFVAAFNQHPARTAIYWQLEQIVQDILLAKLPCDVWLDGSLLTSVVTHNTVASNDGFGLGVTANNSSAFDPTKA